MNESTTVLCTVIIVIGLLRCLIAGTTMEKHFSLISGIVVLVIILNNIANIEFESYSDNYSEKTNNSDYERIVEDKATSIIEENVCRSLKGRYGYECEADVTLAYVDGTYVVKRVIISGGEEVGYIKEYLSDYLSLDEGCIDFV